MDASNSKPKRPRPSPRVILRGHTSALTAVSFVPVHTEPDRYLLTGDEKGTIRLWDTTFEETVATFPIPKHLSATPVQSIAIHPSSPASALVQYKTGHVTHLELVYDQLAADFDAWSAHGKSLCVGALPASVSNVRAPGAVFNDSFCRIKFLSPTTWAGPGGDGDALIIRDNREQHTCAELLQSAEDGHTGMLMTLAKAGADLLLTGYEDGTVAVWDTRKPVAPMKRVQAAKETIIASAVSPHGRVAVVGGAFELVAGIADLENDLAVVETGSLKKKGIADIVWRDDGKLIATAGWDGAVRVWDGRRKPGSLLKSKGCFKWHDGTVQCLTYSQNGKLLASGGKDRTVALWDGI